jgi:hydrogenase maturation protein HypF
LPDIATCGDCLREIFDPGNRRYLYPFTNCTHCGPRYTIIEALPYDRCNTSMRSFTLCPECQREYENPMDRRFHAQPNACPACGPWLELRGPDGEILGARQEALRAAVQALKQGLIVAVKGIGGFHLMVDAGSEEAVQRLRSRKHREEKPFGLMFPQLQSVRETCWVTPLEERLLLSPEAPLVLLPKKQAPAGGGIKIADGIAPGNPWLGVLLPYSPLHHILLQAFQAPLVATSANLSEEPICTD